MHSARTPIRLFILPCCLSLFVLSLQAQPGDRTRTAGQPVQDTAALVFKAEALLGEGAIWHPQRRSLLWVDIEGKTLHEYLPETKTPAEKSNTSEIPGTPANSRYWRFDRMVSTVVPESDSTVVIGLQNTVARVNLHDGSHEEIARIDDRDGLIRTNDGKCDPEGRLWIGTMAFAGTPGAGTLYCLGADTGNIPSPKIDSVTISNGIVWSADRRTMYYIDTPTRRVARYAYDAPTGTIRYEGTAVTIPEGRGFPDGMTIDAEGNLWIALWGGWGVECWNPQTGELLRKIAVPCPNVTSCAFGGESLDTLYITTATGEHGSETRKRYPLSGSLFSCKPGVRGMVPCFFSKKN